MTSNVITGYFQGSIISNPFSAINAVKKEWQQQAQSMRKATNSYEDVIKARIAASNARTERLQDSGDYYTADREIAYADGLLKALAIYQEWCL